ncbi:Hpt domain-containing protein [Pedobacter sp. SAFR-022]|uniref:Hpt domain-containing protein n=1 Tax=Pedobacter sp. SAFR-022 TaxID=3436861 RepID=UPI003F7D198F
MIDKAKNAEPLDLSYLRDMSGDSIEFMIEMLEMFKQQTPIYIDDLSRALEEKNWPKVSSCAHKIKPTFAYVGREDAKNHMQLMEVNARDQKDLEALPAALEELNSFIAILNVQIDTAKSELEKQL